MILCFLPQQKVKFYGGKTTWDTGSLMSVVGRSRWQKGWRQIMAINVCDIIKHHGFFPNATQMFHTVLTRVQISCKQLLAVLYLRTPAATFPEVRSTSTRFGQENSTLHEEATIAYCKLPQILLLP